MSDDKLRFIVSYSEIVCNKIYVLITLEKFRRTFSMSQVSLWELFSPLFLEVVSKFTNDTRLREGFLLNSI